ncbi:MAG: aminotransferase class IV [Sphaerochaetaceae bacterium]
MENLGKHAILNGELIKATDALLPVGEKAFLYGFGVYESLKVLKSTVIYLDEHIERLFFSASGIELRHPFKGEQIRQWLQMLIEHDRMEEATVRILLMGGIEPRLFITAEPLLTYPDSFYKEGVKGAVYHGERFLPRYKTCSLLLNYMALRQASSMGAFEALLVNPKGLILEGTRTNIFACREAAIYTAPKTVVLEGVTRHKIIEGIRELGLDLIYEAPRLDLLLTGHYSELFISSTSMGAMPIAQVGDYRFNAPFTLTNSLHTLITERERATLP